MGIEEGEREEKTQNKKERGREAENLISLMHIVSIHIAHLFHIQQLSYSEIIFNSVNIQVMATLDIWVLECVLIVIKAILMSN